MSIESEVRKGIGRQGMVLKRRNAPQKEPMPYHFMPWFAQPWTQHSADGRQVILYWQTKEVGIGSDIEEDREYGAIAEASQQVRSTMARRSGK